MVSAGASQQVPGFDWQILLAPLCEELACCPRVRLSGRSGFLPLSEQLHSGNRLMGDSKFALGEKGSLSLCFPAIRCTSRQRPPRVSTPRVFTSNTDILPIDSTPTSHPKTVPSGLKKRDGNSFKSKRDPNQQVTMRSPVSQTVASE